MEPENLNPFKGLQSTVNSPTTTINTYDQTVNSLIENVFLFTVRKNVPKGKQFIYLEEGSKSCPNSLINLDFVEHALFERLLLPNPGDYLMPNNERNAETDEVVAETQVLKYLFKSFCRNEKLRNDSSTVVTDTSNRIGDLILRNMTTAIKQPELFDGQSMSQQWVEVFRSNDYDDDFVLKVAFLKSAARAVYFDDEAVGMESLKSVFHPMFHDVIRRVHSSSMTNLEKWIVPFVRSFAQDKTNIKLAELVLDFSTPAANADGIKYAETLLGQLLSLSILPKNHNGPFEYYDNPTEVMASNLTDSLWSYLQSHLNDLHLLFKDFLVLGGVAREKLLNWIGNCLQANTARGQIWNTQQLSVLGSMKTVSDAFIINLTGVLLRLCKPLLKPQMKVMSVDPTYCNVVEADRADKGVHMKGMDKETCLLPTDDEEGPRFVAEKYNFVTECFFLTHKAIDLGYRVCTEKLTRMNREIHRLRGPYQDAVAQNEEELASNLLQMLTTKTQQYLCLQNTIVEPVSDQLLAQFYQASSVWLAQITANPNRTDENTLDKGFAPQTIKEIVLPIPGGPNKFLKSIPEFVIENIVNYLTFSRHFETQAIDSDPEAQISILTMILVFMGSSERARNPHLRARLAEGLESLLPKAQGNFQVNFKAILFTTHPFRFEIVPNLLRVFVEIEMTGQSVQFEQKFNYRRPMYAIMDYLWAIEEQKEYFKKLAIDAERDIDAVNPPIFLRFINLLINDAIFLLDESISNLQQIRTLQAAEANGEWASLPQAEQQQNRANLQHLGMMAKFDNILGRDTIRILKLITSEIKGIFCHVSMVDRVVAMLNYFLLQLVGPKMGNLKVKDKKEFEFDPAHTVREICRIYTNLEESESFCLAVSQDGRSYSPQLFEYAEQVLVRIGGGQLIGEISELSEKVQRLEKQQKLDQEALADPPDDFLDPIMSTLMLDPVTLPSSKVTVDRPTIARHLLSDQTDPFNRSPLTMDQVIPNVELREKIYAWMKERREAFSNKRGEDPVA